MEENNTENSKDKMKDRDIVKLVLNAAGMILGIFLIIVNMPDDFGSVDFKEKNRTNTDILSASDDADDKSEVLGTRTGKVRNTAAKLASDNKQDKEDAETTVMIYMPGSDLESEKHEATDDIAEMIESGIGSKVNVVIQTMGTKEWHGYGIASDHTQIYRVKNHGLEIVKDDLKQLDSTSPETLSSFIKFSSDNFPAKRYILLFWDHGAGPVYGFGCDEWMRDDDSLTLDEISIALDENKDIHFDLIGMDCCIMANIETAYALRDHCDKAVLSEDFVSNTGWDYKEWMSALEQDPDMGTDDIGRMIIDSTVKCNESVKMGRGTTIVLIDESKAGTLFKAWSDYARLNGSSLFLQENINLPVIIEGEEPVRSVWKKIGSSASLGDYYLNDVKSLMDKIDDQSAEALRLNDALDNTVIYFGQTKDSKGLKGMSVTIPYGDEEFYDKFRKVYKGLGIDDAYIEAFGKEIGSEFALVTGDEDRDEIGIPASGPGVEKGKSPEGYEYELIKGDWKWDDNEKVWYLEDEDVMYLYDESEKSLYYYDKKDGNIYCYDDELEGGWSWYE